MNIKLKNLPVGRFLFMRISKSLPFMVEPYRVIEGSRIAYRGKIIFKLRHMKPCGDVRTGKSGWFKEMKTIGMEQRSQKDRDHG